MPSISRKTFHDIIDGSQLPKSYCQNIRPSRYVGVSQRAVIDRLPANNIHEVASKASDWCSIPDSLVKELDQLPWERVVGRGVLVRDGRSNTALVSIAEAAVLLLVGVSELLECILWAVDESIRTYTTDGSLHPYEINWWYKTNFQCRAEVIIAPLRDHKWAFGLRHWRNSMETVALTADVMQVLEWINGILKAPDNQSNGLCLVNPVAFDDRGRISMDAYFDPMATAKLGFPPRRRQTIQQIAPVRYQSDESNGGCWRRKIRKGIILSCIADNLSSEPHTLSSSSSRTPELLDLSDTADSDADSSAGDITGVLDRYKDCLVLTAGALWSLFGNGLHERPNCCCTFQGESQDFLTFVGKMNGWFVWHVEADESKVCGGGSECSNNTKIELRGENALHTSSPCILRWPAEVRTCVDRYLSTQPALTEKFLKNPAVSFTPKQLQIGGTLGVSKGATAQVSTALNYQMDYYEIAPQAPFDEEWAQVISQFATILLYCEKRRLHLAIEGSDLIEILCIHILLQLGCTDILEFRGMSASKRMPEWRASSFTTSVEGRISGKQLVRAAGNRLTQFLEKVKEVPETQPVYWCFQSLISGSKCYGLAAPLSTKSKEWYKVWKARPLLAVAVGCISEDLISKDLAANLLGRKTKGLLSKIISKILPNNWRSDIKVVKHEGGLLADNARMRALLSQASVVYRATTADSEYQTDLGGDLVNLHPVFQILQQTDINEQVTFEVNCRTCNTIPSTSCCVHYFL